MLFLSLSGQGDLIFIMVAKNQFYFGCKNVIFPRQAFLLVVERRKFYCSHGQDKRILFFFW